MREHYVDLEGNERLIKTTQENVRAQLDHLRTHPSVALQLRKSKVDLHGWVYSILTGDIWVYDFDNEQFTSLLDEAYLERHFIAAEDAHVLGEGEGVSLNPRRFMGTN